MKYLIIYWTEYNDEATDFEIIIDASNEEDAINKFKEMDLVYKKIDKIIPYEL